MTHYNPDQYTEPQRGLEPDRTAQEILTEKIRQVLQNISSEELILELAIREKRQRHMTCPYCEVTFLVENPLLLLEMK